MKSILLVKKLSGLIEMTSGLVNASFSLPWMVSCKNNFLCTLKQFLKLCLIVDVWIHNLFPFLAVFAFRQECRLDFRCSLGPSREETAERVSGLSCLWRKFKIWFMRCYKTSEMGKVIKYQTRVVLCLVVTLVFAIKISRDTNWLYLHWSRIIYDYWWTWQSFLLC